MAECPLGHSPYAYEHLADRAVTLHRWAYPHCPPDTFAPFPCGDHYHVGHRRKIDGDTCKAAHPTARIKGHHK